MSKKPTVIKEKTIIASEYYEALEDIIAACNKMYTYSNNPQSEIYRIARFVTIFASQVAYLDYLRQETDAVIKSGDTFLIKRQIRQRKFCLSGQVEKQPARIPDDSKKDDDTASHKSQRL